MDNYENCVSLRKKGKLNPGSTLYPKMTSRWVKALNVKKRKEKNCNSICTNWKNIFYNLE